MASELVLQIEHMLCQLITGDFIRFLLLPFLADLVILAKKAAQIAVGKEYRSRAPVAGKSRFLSVMVAVRGNDRQRSRMTVSVIPLQTVGTAPPRADIARNQSLVKPPRPPFEFTGFIKG
jgi:hypothetical protein